ncbi:hypothetical protein BDZ97DRAFT_1152505 [Flammula alnicola]|nr:hypothetical protein BDZ97DRAFT_1152505 [Flammula alnicola]
MYSVNIKDDSYTPGVGKLVTKKKERDPKYPRCNCCCVERWSGLQRHHTRQICWRHWDTGHRVLSKHSYHDRHVFCLLRGVLMRGRAGAFLPKDGRRAISRLVGLRESDNVPCSCDQTRFFPHGAAAPPNGRRSSRIRQKGAEAAESVRRRCVFAKKGGDRFVQLSFLVRPFVISTFGTEPTGPCADWDATNSFLAKAFSHGQCRSEPSREIHKRALIFASHLSPIPYNFIAFQHQSSLCSLTQTQTTLIEMHSAAATFTTTTAVVASTHHQSSSTSATAISSESSSCINHSSPQCCHCGWRGSHSPNCPFK